MSDGPGWGPPPGAPSGGWGPPSTPPPGPPAGGWGPPPTPPGGSSAPPGPPTGPPSGPRPPLGGPPTPPAGRGGGIGGPGGPTDDGGPNWPLVIGVGVVVVLFVAAIAWQLVGDGGTDRSDLVTSPPTSNEGTAAPSTTVPSSFPPPPTIEVPEGGFSSAEISEHFGDAVWRVEVQGCETESSGSGFAVTPRHVVTNHHVAVIDSSPTLVDRHGTTVQGRVIGMIQEPDVALIEVDRDLSTYLEWADPQTLSEGQPLVAMGYPLPATDFTVTSLSIASFDDELGPRAGIRADGNIDRGNSGGPSLTNDGKVAGINTAVNINQGGASSGIFGGGLQVVPLVLTHAAVVNQLDEFMASTETIEADCSKALISEAQTYGDNLQLDQLWDACDLGDPFSCDILYDNAKGGSEYELFARTCGGRLPDGRGYCAQRYQGFPMAPNAPPEGEPPPPDGGG